MINCLLFLMMSLQSPTIFMDDPVTTAAPLEDAELKKMEWNRYTSKSFTILSIDNQKGKELSETLEGMKKTALGRWGFPDFKFTKECRVFVVPDYVLLKKLFNLNVGKAQLRKELNVIWCVGDDKPQKSLMPLLTQVCISEYESVQNTILPVWFKRGSILLSNPVSDIRESLKSFNDVARKEQFTHSAEQVFSTTDDEYNKQTNENKNLFDQQSACLCLMLRKEFGEVKLQGFLRLQNKNRPESLLDMIYGFKSFSQFDRQYVRYMKELCADVSDNLTPDSYLEIKAVR